MSDIREISWKTNVNAASTANVNLSTPGLVVDGVTVVKGIRVLLKNQTNAVQNGIYEGKSDGRLYVHDHCNDEDSAQYGIFVRVIGGSTNINKEYYLAPIAPNSYRTAPKNYISSPFINTGGGGGGLSTVTVDGTLSGDGTAGNPLSTKIKVVVVSGEVFFEITNPAGAAAGVYRVQATAI